MKIILCNASDVLVHLTWNLRSENLYVIGFPFYFFNSLIILYGMLPYLEMNSLPITSCTHTQWKNPLKSQYSIELIFYSLDWFLGWTIFTIIINPTIKNLPSSSCHLHCKTDCYIITLDQRSPTKDISWLIWQFRTNGTCKA